MLPQPKRAEFIKAFGEQGTKAIESILDTISKAADEAGIEKKEAKTYKNLFADTVMKAAKERQQESEMIYKKIDMVAHLKETMAPTTTTKAAPVQAGPPPLATGYPFIGQQDHPIGAALEGKSIVKEQGQDDGDDGSLLGGLFSLNQAWGRPKR